MKNKITGLLIVTSTSIGMHHEFNNLVTACFMAVMVMISSYCIVKLFSGSR